MKKKYTKNTHPTKAEAKAQRKKFNIFDEENPHLYVLFKRFVWEAIDKEKVIGARLVFERIRWWVRVETDGTDHFSISNTWAPYYTRKFAEEFPEYRHFLTRRASIADIA